MWFSAGKSLNELHAAKEINATHMGAQLKRKNCIWEDSAGAKELWKADSPQWYVMLAIEDPQWHYDQAQE